MYHRHQTVALMIVLLLSATTEAQDTQNGSAAADAKAAEVAPAKEVQAPVDPKAAKAKAELDRINGEKDRLAAEIALRELKLKDELAKFDEEKQRLQAAYDLAQLRVKVANAKLEEEKQTLEAQQSLAAARQKQELAELSARNEKLTKENELATTLMRKEQLQFEVKQSQVQRESTLLALENTRLEMALAKHQHELTKLQSNLELRNTKQQWRDVVDKETAYPEQPFAKGVLTVSDRRIALNDAIIEGSGEHIAKRIHYFNNQSETAPIFIIIDDCPGGSILEGYRILKSMESSRAPIHVVVKSYAASMAAIIVGVAQHSYCFPNAIILHHQPSNWGGGNITQQTEQLENIKEWARRVHTPVARKMGIELEQFYQRMYQKNSDGDWHEFGDDARKEKWVDHLVTELRETGIVKKPADDPPSPDFWFLSFEADGGKPRLKPSVTYLPPLRPFDHYFLHNPNRRFRWDDYSSDP